MITIEYYEERYKKAVEEFGKESFTAKMYKAYIDNIKSGFNEKSVAEVFNDRPMS